MITTSYSKLINSQTTHQLSSNKYHRRSAEEYLIHLVTKNTSPVYNNALKFSGCNENIQFTSTPLPRRNRNRKIKWFNPPYSVNVKTNIGRIFLHLIEKHFPQHQKYRRLFNGNNVKMRCSCMPNLLCVIWNQNTSLLKDHASTEIKECSCRQKTECPLDKKCLSGYLVYNILINWLDTNKTK